MTHTGKLSGTYIFPLRHEPGAFGVYVAVVRQNCKTAKKVFVPPQFPSVASAMRAGEKIAAEIRRGVYSS